MKRSPWLPILLLAAAIAGCSREVPGPEPPDPAILSAVRVTRIVPVEDKPYDVLDEAESIASSWALSEYGWVEARGRTLEPIYRLEFVSGTDIVAVYWLGTNAHPPRFPCYAICSGWWIGASTATGELDTTRYKGLTSTHYFHLLGDLRVWR